MKKFLLFSLLSLSCFVVAAQSFTTKGNTFWLAYMENLDLFFNGDPGFSIYVYAEYSGGGVIAAPATGFNVPFLYTANEITEVVLPPAIYYDEGSEDIENYGLRINLDTEGYVFALHYRLYFSEATALLPEPVLGDRYIVTAVLDHNGNNDSPSSFVVLATEDNTILHITPAALTLGLRPAGVPFSITLDEGQTYQVQSLGDLSGSAVETEDGQSIAVFGGALKANVGCADPADSHCYDQLMPLEAASTTYPLIPFGGQNVSLVKVTATMDNTVIQLGQTVVDTLHTGEFLQTEINSPVMLEASNPVFAVLLNPSQNCFGGALGDPNMLHLASTEMRGSHLPVQHFDFFDPGNNQFFITLFTETALTSNVQVDGIPVEDEFVLFPGNELYSYARIAMEPGQHLVESETGVLAYAYGFGPFDAYTYHLGYEEPVGVSVKELPEAGCLFVLPNPVYGQLWLHNHSNNHVTNVRLFNASGHVVRSTDLLSRGQVIPWEVRNLSEGVYFLCYDRAGISRAEKVVVVKQ